MCNYVLKRSDIDISKKEEAWSIIQPACHQDGGAPNLQQRSWARCDEDYSCRHKTSCQNQLPQLQGGHESHKTFSKSTPQNPRNQSRGGTCPTKRSLRAPLQCVPVKSKKSKFNCKLANGSHQSRCIQNQGVQCAQDLQLRSGQ